MKALIKTTRRISAAELAEVSELFPDITFDIVPITNTPTPQWNPWHKLIEIDWKWFRELFGTTSYDIHCYVTDHQTLKNAAITKYIGLYSLDNDQTHEFWFGVPEKLRSKAKNNGFKSNFAWLFVHELLHGKEHFSARKDRVHTMEEQGRLKELATEYGSPPKKTKPEYQRETIKLATQLKNLLIHLLAGRYHRPLPNHWDKVTQPYLNYNPDVYTATGHHPGTDFAAPLGTPVLAPDDGEITRSSYSPSLGNWVEFRFGELYLVALHLANKQTPRKVKKGEPIGFIGNTGLIFGIHAHLEVWSRPMNRELLTSKAMLEAVTLDVKKLIK